MKQMFLRASFERPSVAWVLAMLVLIAGSLIRLATAVLPGTNASLIPFSDGRAIFYMTNVDALLTEANPGQVISQIGPTLVQSCVQSTLAMICVGHTSFQHSLPRHQSIISISFQN